MLQTISYRFFRQTQRMFTAQWVACLFEFLLSSMFVGRFSYLANNFYITAGAVGSSFSPGSPKVREKKFSEHVRECICRFSDERLIDFNQIQNNRFF